MESDAGRISHAQLLVAFLVDPNIDSTSGLLLQPMVRTATRRLASAFSPTDTHEGTAPNA